MHSTVVMQNTSIGDVQSRYEMDLGYNKVTIKDSNTHGIDGFGNGSYHNSISNSNNSKHSEDTETMATPPSHTNVEDSLSKELLKLSMSDRNAMEEEIHGVRCLGVTKETPELLQQSLREFDKELMALKNNPTRIASVKHQKTASVRRRSSKVSISNISQTPPIDVLQNVIDTTKQYTTIPNNNNNNHTTINATTNATAQQQECYLNDPDVRLRFLRCESFDARESAKRFVRFLELAKEVFGDFVAERPIRLSDFFEAPGGGRLRRYQQHEKKALSNSKIQYLPFRDRSGRRVKVGVGECNAELDLNLRIKINLLMDWIASEDVETQQKGVVNIVWPFDSATTTATTTNASSNTAAAAAAAGYNSGGSNNNPTSGGSSCSEGEDEKNSRNWEGFLRPKYSRNDMIYHNRYYHAQPLRVAAVHWCSQDKPIYRVLNNLYYFSLDSKSQSRYKVHFGEPLEIRYQLQAFGIPVDLLPLTHTMALKRQHHSQSMSSRRYIEEQRKQQQQRQKQQQTYQQQQFQRRQQQFQQQQQFLRQNLLKQPWDDERAMKFFESTASSTPGMPQGNPASTNGPPIVVECPRSHDVIIGKAKVCTNNPGNGFYSSLIEATHDEHDSLDHARDKVAMTWRILLYITEERQGRFLDWNKSLNAWVVIQDRIVIRKKIANSYKEYKRSRYVTGRSPKTSKKKQAASDDTKQEDSGGSTATALNRSNHNTYSANSKRRKISGCLNSGDGTSNHTQSMFAAL